MGMQKVSLFKHLQPWSSLRYLLSWPPTNNPYQ